MMKKLFLSLGALLVAGGCSATQEESKSSELTVSAAASLQDVLGEIEAQFEEETGIEVTLNYGSSGSLKQQISQGAPVDLFISAAENHFDELVEDGVISESESVRLIGNELVLVVPRDDFDIATFEGLTEVESLSIGTPETVPAGMYSQEVFEELGIWEDVQEQIVFAKDVRQVLTYVESGNVDAGVVYQSDALAGEQLKIAAVAQEEWHTPIVYPAGIIEDTDYREDAEAFFEYLQSEEAMALFEELGFKRLN
ncbi:molybdate ABC transporter substrate-binding protein [Jeotgalibacillus sp. JSM ZJ347]|uniref:molybdate ABC transporter substrate-binding protein n=1 Tax=Jeotgalibacillus sp. JSM ZJ347 TaxID=3342117 RepID=UPI0035A98D7A